MKILPIFIPHAGCPHTCLFCDQNSTSQHPDLPGPEAVLAAINTVLSVGCLDEIAFYGGSFTALPLREQKTFLDLAAPFLQQGKIGGVRLSTRPDAITEEIVEFLKTAGVTTVELGCQSFNDSVLAAAERGHVSADAGQAVPLLRSRQIKVGIQLMPGLPGGGRTEALSSLESALRLQPDFLRIYPAVVLKGTGLAELWHRGKYQPFTLEQAVDTCADIALICQERAVPVVRYGLQSNDLLGSGAVLAGPYHPAFGQMVRSRIWLRTLTRLSLDGVDTVSVHPSDLSDALGHGRSNIDRIRTKSVGFSVEPAADVDRFRVGVRGSQYSLYDLAVNGK